MIENTPPIPSRIFSTDIATGAPRRFCGCDHVLASNQDSSWADTMKVEVQALGVHEEPETAPLEHCVSLKLSGCETLEWRLGGRRFQNRSYQASEFCLVSSGTPVWARWQHGGEFLVIAIPDAFARLVAEGVSPCTSVEFVNRWTFHDHSAEHLAKTMLCEIRAGCPGGRLFGESLATAFTAHMLRHHSVSPSRSKRQIGGLSSAGIRRVVDYVQAHIGEELSLRQLAALTDLSAYHFAHMFKQSTGKAPHRYVLMRRIEFAKTLLEHTRLPLAEVALRSGFASQSHFTVMFRKFVGCAPGVYRASKSDTEFSQ
jgi:AraC family transcriptional regulator